MSKSSMAKSVALLATGVFFTLFAPAPRALPPKGEAPPNEGVLSFTVKANDGKEKALSGYRGKVLLIVNTASKCGYTPQYKGLEALYQKYRDRGFMILAFPANNFAAQEPGTDSEIRAFCSTKYNVTFDLFAKTSVKGAGISPLYEYLTRHSGFGGDISWNFNKFLVDRSGNVVARYDSKVDPLSDKLVQDVERLLDEK